MKAIICNAFGPLEQLCYGEHPTPVAAAGQVLINIKAVGVNFPDGLLVEGRYQAKPDFPFVPGGEFSGEIAALGEGVVQRNVGERVACFNPTFGAYAEQAVIPADCAIPIPASMSFADASIILCAHGTAHHALKQRANLKRGETLLVLGAAGGTGVAAVQIGKAMGARVIAACSSAEKLEVAKANGADELIDYSEQKLKATIKELTGGKGVDVVFDPVGGDLFNDCTRLMARNGRLLVIGFASGEIPKLPVNLPLVKEYAVVGVFWGSFTQHQPEVFAENMYELFRWYQQGKISLVVDDELPLSEAVTALQKVMQRKVTGKLLLIP